MLAVSYVVDHGDSLAKQHERIGSPGVATGSTTRPKWPLNSVSLTA
jgi:hypothetical protein